jgi:hypothetical protein
MFRDDMVPAEYRFLCSGLSLVHYRQENSYGREVPMFSVLMQAIRSLLFGSVTDLFLSPEQLPSCAIWEFAGQATRQVWCVCETIAVAEVCAGLPYSPNQFLEVWWAGREGGRPLLWMQLGIQGD